MINKQVYEVTVFENNRTEWRQFGLLHRLDGPAIIYLEGKQVWYYEGKYHRTSGPAITFADGENEYWVHGAKLSKEDFDLRTVPSLDGKKVDIDGIKYTLKEMK